MKKIALIGIGKMGISHLAIAKQTPGLDVVAVCDTSKPLLKVLKRNSKIATFSDFKKMIDSCDVDGVMIMVPNSYHYSIAKYCIDKGLDIFIEKPFCLTYSESKELVELARKNGVKGQVGYVNRFNPVFRKVKSMLENGIIGEIHSYINRMTGGVILNENSKGWRNDYSKGGGCLYDYGPHCIDLAIYLFGTDVNVKASSLKKVFSTKVDDVVFTTLIHNEKIIGINYVNWSDSSSRKANNTIEICGSLGRLVVNKQEMSVFLTEKYDPLELDKGWNQIYITDECTDVPYYLRGEDFSLQLIEFSKLLNREVKESTASLFDASVTDRIIEETKSLSKKLL